MATSTKISEVLKTTSPLSAKCENCGCRPKAWYKGERRNWCSRCIKIYERSRTITYEQTEKNICEVVGPLYIGAVIEDLKTDLRTKLVSRKYSQDVFFHGPIGTGKTYAMAALARSYIEQGLECKRINFDDFCLKVRSSMSPASELTEWDMIKPMKDVDILFIDDLGLRSKQETDFAYVTLYSILNKRQELMLPTVISSNKDINRLSQSFDARIASRLSTALIIEMKGEDRRAIAKISGKSKR